MITIIIILSSNVLFQYMGYRKYLNQTKPEDMIYRREDIVDSLESYFNSKKLPRQMLLVFAGLTIGFGSIAVFCFLLFFIINYLP